MGFSGCILGTVEKLPPILFKWQTFLFDYFVKLIILFLPVYISIPSSNHEFTARGNPGFTMVYHPKIWVFPCLFHGFPWVFHGFPLTQRGDECHGGHAAWCLHQRVPEPHWPPSRVAHRGGLSDHSTDLPAAAQGATDLTLGELNWTNMLWQCVGLGYIYNYYCIVIGSKL